MSKGEGKLYSFLRAENGLICIDNIIFLLFKIVICHRARAIGKSRCLEAEQQGCWFSNAVLGYGHLQSKVWELGCSLPAFFKHRIFVYSLHIY